MDFEYYQEDSEISPNLFVSEEDRVYYNPESSPSMIFSWIFAIAEILIGIFLLMIVNETLGPFILSLSFLAAGLIIHLLPGFRNPYARRAFVLSFCTCVLVMGLAQNYAKVSFGEVQTTVDSKVFYDLTHAGKGTETLETLSAEVHSPLPTLCWRMLFSVFSPFFGEGPWLPILLNSFIVGMAGSITVIAGSYLLGNNPYSLHRLGTLFSCCGMFWLFGAIFLRDSFALLVNVIFLWACLRVLTLPSLKNFFISAVTMFFSVLLMGYIRKGLLSIFILIILLAFFSWTRRKKSSVLMYLLLPLVLFVGLILLPVISSYTGEVTSEISRIATAYGKGRIEERSLGATMIVNQPPVIRIVFGSVFMLIQPIPLWRSFQFYAPEYQWIKGCQGIYLVLIVPAVFAGLGIAMKRAFYGGAIAPPACFAAFYVIFTTMAVAATSLETRHHGQFLPVFLILAVLPDRTDPVVCGKIRLIMLSWFACVFGIHIMWIALKL